MTRIDPADISDLPAYWDQRADDYEQDRLRCIADHNYVGAAYYMGRVDMARSAAGELRGMLGDPRDEEAAAIERLDGHKHAGDPWVLQSAR